MLLPQRLLFLSLCLLAPLAFVATHGACAPENKPSARHASSLKYQRKADALPPDSPDLDRVAVLIISSQKPCSKKPLVLKTCGAARVWLDVANRKPKGAYLSVGHCLFGDAGKHSKQRVWLAQSVAVARKLVPTHSRDNRPDEELRPYLDAIEEAQKTGSIHELSFQEQILPRTWEGIHTTTVGGDIALLVDDAPFEQHEALRIANKTDLETPVRLPAIGTNDCITRTEIRSTSGEALELWDDPLIGRNYALEVLRGVLVDKPSRSSFINAVPAALTGTFAFSEDAEELRLWDALGDALFADLGPELVACSGDSGLPWLNEANEIVGLQSVVGFIRLSPRYKKVYTRFSNWVRDQGGDKKPLQYIPDDLFRDLQAVEATRHGYAMLSRANTGTACRLFTEAQSTRMLAAVPSICK